MAPNLLCTEESIICFNDGVVDDNNINNEYELVEALSEQQEHQTYNQNLNFLHRDGFFIEYQSEEDLVLMFQREPFHLPRDDYFKRLQNGEVDLKIRSDTIDWIGKVHGYHNFGPLSAYLSINYLDRFLSAYELPRGKSWMMQLLAVACLSIAAKMEETELTLSLDLQVCEPEFIFEAKTIQRMELLVLSTLNWRMQSVTPFSFIDYFLTKINGGQPSRFLISQSFALILSTLRGIDFFEFKPSELAAAVAIYVSLGGIQTMQLEMSAFGFTQLIDKDKLLKCLGMIQAMSLENGSFKIEGISLSSVPQSPNGVLDITSLSYKSDDSVEGSSANFIQTSQASSKRRRLK
ncbi:hypothetical protein MKX01_019829 [Papaver californicum]|nr:hypothetical protein MKX01_019829 [Papaver californicum]